MIGDSNDEANFPHKLLLLTNTQVSKIHKAIANDSSVNIKFLKTQLFKMVQFGGFLPLTSDPLDLLPPFKIRRSIPNSNN